MSEPSEIIDRTIDALSKHGWIQGNYGSPIDGFCLMGAMVYGYDRSEAFSFYDIGGGQSPAFQRVYLEIQKVCIAQYGEGWIPDVNDDKIKTKDQAIAILEGARASLQELG